MFPTFPPVHRLVSAFLAVRRWLVAAAVVSLYCLAGPAHAVEALTAVQRTQLLHSATHIAWPTRAAHRSAGGKHPLGIQTLAIEPVHHKRRGLSGQARIYQFDHDRALARRLVLALDDGRLISNEAVSSVHLPLNAAERHWVVEQLAMSVWLRNAVDVPVPSLQASAFVFEPDDPDALCHVGRCALVSLARSDGTVLAIEPVVEFMTAIVRPLDVSGVSRHP